MAEVIVRWADLGSTPDPLGAPPGWLDPAARARMEALRAADDRRRFVAARDLLRRTVAEVTGTAVDEIALEQRCEQCGGPHGRPTVRVAGRPGPPVSMAHAAGLVLVAVGSTHQAVGVDLEPREQLEHWADLAPVALSDTERRALDEIPTEMRPERVLRTWVRKEALLKALGTGLDLDPRLVELTPTAPIELSAWSGLGPTPVVTIRDLDPPEGYLAAVAELG